jgi:hypothetical protein
MAAIFIAIATAIVGGCQLAAGPLAIHDHSNTSLMFKLAPSPVRSGLANEQ